MPNGKTSRDKGARGERLWRDVLRAAGFDPATTYRGRQFSGMSPDGVSPDVVCRELPTLHWEVKNVERLNLRDAYAQAVRDAGEGKTPIVAHKKNNANFLVTLSAEDFLEIVRRSDLIEGGSNASGDTRCDNAQ